jgi:hypothetical protein
MDEPLDLCLRIIELRQYARIKDAVDRADSDARMPKGPMSDLVFEIEHELLKERQERIKARAAARERGE